jgi:uncharacterized protein
MRDHSFEWDDDKARINLEKHEISIDLARHVFDDPAREERLDDDPVEERWIAIGMADGRVLFVVFTERDGRMRIISARKANKNEQARYFSGL